MTLAMKLWTGHATRADLIGSPDDYLEPLDSGALSGLGLDVCVLLTPHVRGTHSTPCWIFAEVSHGIYDVLAGHHPQTVGNLDVYRGVPL